MFEPRKTKAIINIKAYLFKKFSTYLYRTGSRAKTTFDPSSGGIGIKLKNPNTMLTNTIRYTAVMALVGMPHPAPKRAIKPKTIARQKLATTPANETSNMPFLGFVKLRSFTGTGLAQPNNIGE